MSCSKISHQWPIGLEVAFNVHCSSGARGSILSTLSKAWFQEVATLHWWQMLYLVALNVIKGGFGTSSHLLSVLRTSKHKSCRARCATLYACADLCVHTSSTNFISMCKLRASRLLCHYYSSPVHDGSSFLAQRMLCLETLH